MQRLSLCLPRKQPRRLVLLGWVVLITLLVTHTSFAYQDQGKQSRAFTYQGQLKEGSVPANGTYDLQFALYTAQGGGQKLGVVIREDVVVTNGSFTVQLDFGSEVVNSDESWLEVGVRPANGAEYTALTPRQRLTPTPYAILAQAEPWSLIGVPVGFPRGADSHLASDKIADNSVTSEKIADGQVVKSVNSIKDHLTLAAGNNVTITPSGNTLTIASQDSSVWVKDGTTARLSKSTDRVGIGTTMPVAKLDVVGDIHASEAITVGNSVGLLSSPTVNLIEVDSPTGNPLLAIGFSNPFNPAPFPGPFSTIKVGIGTLSPTATLHINGTTRFSGIATLDNSPNVRLRAAANGGARILGEQGNTPVRPAIGFFSTNGIDDSGGGLGIFRPAANAMGFATASAERMRITSGGLVGIGTPAPTQSLDVNGQARIRVLTLNPALNNVVVANANGVLFTRPASTLGGGNFWSLAGNTLATGNEFLGTTNGFPLRLFTNNAEQMRVDTNGNVGIGVTNPQSKLSVGAAGTSLSQAYIAKSGGFPTRALTVEFDNNMGIFINPLTGGTTGMALWANGRGHFADLVVGNNGTTTNFGYSPGPDNFHVVGTIRVDGMAAGPTSPTVCWNSTTHVLVQCGMSDTRLKTNVSQLTRVLEKLGAVRGVSFAWNSTAKSIGLSSDRREIGVIAQEVEAVFPEVVISPGGEGYKTVDYSKLTAVLIEAVKELKAENDALKQRLEALEKAVMKR